MNNISLDQMLFSVFFPFAAERIYRAQVESQRFVHYTTADTMMRIITGNQVWMRKSGLMNDYREVEHGYDCLDRARRKHADLLQDVFDNMFAGFTQRLNTEFDRWMPSFRSNTFITCISEHLPEEDKYGRLSMWRAYGGQNGVALVINGGPFLRPSHALRAYTSPVAYLNDQQFETQFLRTVNAVRANQDILRPLGSDMIFNQMFGAFRAAVLCTKHPGFHEEREWRVIYSPSMAVSQRIHQSIESVGGVPQLVCKIPFEDVPNEGLVGLELATALDRVIIGPTKFPTGIQDALVSFDLTGLFWTKLCEKLSLERNFGYAEEEVQRGADRGAAPSD